MNKLKFWLQCASSDEKKLFARYANVTTSYLVQIANEHTTPSPAVAEKIAVAANKVRATNNICQERLPILTRGDLSPVCADCDYYKNRK